MLSHNCANSRYHAVTVSRTDVLSAYRLLLGREAADEEAELWINLPSLAELRDTFLASSEFEAAVSHQDSRWRQPPHSLASLIDTSPPLPIEWKTDASTEAKLVSYVQETWTKLGEEEPHWSVLSSDQFKSSKIQDHQNEFYRSGVDEAGRIHSILSRCGLSDQAHGRLLEFGCGVGRVTPYLAERFDEVIAVDISTSHLRMARERVEEGGLNNVRCVLARAPEFALEPDSFDIWFSHIVLQHNPPPIIAIILKRMFETLAVGGLTIFQVPTYAPGYSFNISQYLSAAKHGAIEVHCLPQSVVFQLAQDAGCVPVDVRQDDAMSYPWISNTFVFRKL
jgi:SAM-dependent methyltransferase